MDENTLNTQEPVSGDEETNQNAENAQEETQSAQSSSDATNDDPLSVKKRLGRQEKKHQREIRELHDRIANLQSSGQPNSGQFSHENPYPSNGQPIPANASEEEKIQYAVRMALGMKEHEERQAKEAQSRTHVEKQYKRLNDEFDRASDKYDDFDEVVRGDDVPFSTHVRDALLLTENPAEVAYKLGKNRAELERISRLHPLDQAREVNKLSFSLMGGNSGKDSATNKSTPLGSIKANPATSSNAVTDKTPPSTIRARMKAGTWK